MSTLTNTELLQHRVIEYLYGDLDAAARHQFEDELQSNTALRELLEQEQRLDSILPVGTQPFVDDERLQGNRWLLRQRLQKELRPRRTLASWLAGLRDRPFAVVMQGAAMAMTFVLGILVATPDGAGTGASTEPPVMSLASSPLDFVGEDDYEIYQLRVNSYDSVSGDIDLSFSLASETRLTGNVGDQQINRLMAVALQDDIDSAARLDTIRALQPVASGNDVFEALIHVLLTDQNPGVRYQAVQALVSLSGQERVRDALRYALQEDVNQGVRVEAFNALSEYRDPQTVQVFREQMENDSNEYIRAQSRLIVESVDGVQEQQQDIF